MPAPFALRSSADVQRPKLIHLSLIQMNEDMERQVEGSQITMDDLKGKLNDVERVSSLFSCPVSRLCRAADLTPLGLCWLDRLIQPTT